MTWDGKFTARCPSCGADAEWLVRPPIGVVDWEAENPLDRNKLVHFPPDIACEACDGVAA